MQVKLAIALLLLSGTVGAQSANVLELSSYHSQRALTAWKSLQKAQADWDAVNDEIKEAYTLVKSGDPDAGSMSTAVNVGAVSLWTNSTLGCFPVIGEDRSCPKESAEDKAKRERESADWSDKHLRFYRRGFENGFDFSKDFRFIVPKVPQGGGSHIQWNIPQCNASGICY
jgi:hypothetical protein